MPRIAASIGVIALIAFSIGFNMARYPRVWEMVGGPLPLMQSEKSLPSQATTEPASAPQTATAARPNIVWQTAPIALAEDKPGDDWADDRSEEPEAGADNEDRYTSFSRANRTYSNTWQPEEELTAGEKYASLAGKIDTFEESKSDEALVPVSSVRLTVRSEIVSPDADDEMDDQSEVAREVQRLPPVDRISSMASGSSASQFSDETITDYPNTGIE